MMGKLYLFCISANIPMFPSGGHLAYEMGVRLYNTHMKKFLTIIEKDQYTNYTVSGY